MTYISSYQDSSLKTPFFMVDIHLTFLLCMFHASLFSMRKKILKQQKEHLNGFKHKYSRES